MPAQRQVFTSESVTEGHPDKIADQISDAVLDAIIAKDPAARVACETLVTTGMAVVAGEITTSTYVHIPDGKTQVSVAYEGMRPVGISKVVVSTQHSDKIDNVELREGVIALVVRPVLADAGFEVHDPDILINPTGRFVVGGPQGDAGLTGRKIIVDTYGGMARHGGGAFSGKDPSKVDRSACYAMRWVAKNVVAAKLASKCEVQIAYAIGKAEPVGLFIETFGTETADPAKISEAILQTFDLRPAAIIRDLDLKRPIYAKTAAYGHFGRELPEFTWERTDRAEQLKKLTDG